MNTEKFLYDSNCNIERVIYIKDKGVSVQSLITVYTYIPITYRKLTKSLQDGRVRQDDTNIYEADIGKGYDDILVGDLITIFDIHGIERGKFTIADIRPYTGISELLDNTHLYLEKKDG